VDFLTSPEGGLAGLGLASFLAATVVPLSSEAVLFANLKLHPDHATLAFMIATAGGMTSYLLGQLLHYLVIAAL